MFNFKEFETKSSSKKKTFFALNKHGEVWKNIRHQKALKFTKKEAK
jgi:hypothetical protein